MNNCRELPGYPRISHSRVHLPQQLNLTRPTFGIEQASAMDLEQLMPHVEALIFASERPLTATLSLPNTSLPATRRSRWKPDRTSAPASIAAVREKYDTEFYPFGLREIGGGYQFLTKKEFHKTVLLSSTATSTSASSLWQRWKRSPSLPTSSQLPKAR